MMSAQSSLQDCYFYFYSSCTKGDECPFRHCELALGTETVCALWREGRCFRSNCKFRHMESRINRSMIPCYWENQPGGCRKPHCVFLHRKLRNGAQVIKDTPGLILPTYDVKTSPTLLGLTETSNMLCKAEFVEKVVENDIPPDPSLTPVTPLVLKVEEGEESDTESISSTPVKLGDKKTALTGNDQFINESGSAEEKDFGIKTLEQIRMEKIHKESDSYYGGAYTSVPLDASRLMDQHYPPKAEFIALPKDPVLDKSIPAPKIEPKVSGVDEETDLRGRLSNRRNISSNKINQVKRLVSFKKQNTNQVEAVSKKLDFKIKTLDEIRKEKENKLISVRVDSTCNNSLDVSPSLENKPSNNLKEKTLRKLKIQRKPREFNPLPITKNEISEPIPTDVTATHVVSDVFNNKVPKSSEDLNGNPTVKKETSVSPGKRKIEDDSITPASKVIKLAAPSNNGCDLAHQVKIEKADENHMESDHHPGNQMSAASEEANNILSPILNSASIKLEREEIDTQSCVKAERNGVIMSTSTSSPPKATHLPDEKTVHNSADNGHILKDKINDKTQHSSALTLNMKIEPSSDSNTRNSKDNLIDRSMSVDDDLDEFLGDDVNIDEIEAAPNDDILLQIDEFLES